MSGTKTAIDGQGKSSSGDDVYQGKYKGTYTDKESRCPSTEIQIGLNEIDFEELKAAALMFSSGATVMLSRGTEKKVSPYHTIDLNGLKQPNVDIPEVSVSSLDLEGSIGGKMIPAQNGKGGTLNLQLDDCGSAKATAEAILKAGAVRLKLSRD